jgi:lysophospholipase L1-like esterase
MFGRFNYQEKIRMNVASAEKKQADTMWKNKNWLAIGDSITYANKYQPLVQNALKIKSVQTDAVPGRPIKPMADNLTAERLKNIDLITVFGGTNDYGSNKILGTIKDEKNQDTFYGNLKNVIEKINANKPEKTTVVFFTPLKRGVFKNQAVYPNANSSGAKLDDYVNAEKQVCKLYSIPVIDLFHKSGLEADNLSKYTIDNLHPNEDGHKMLSKVMIKELKKVAAHN